MEEIDNLIQKIRSQTNSFSQGDYSTTPLMPITNIANVSETIKPSFSEITPYSENSVYKTLSSGEKTPMYENFIPGTDNQERLAQQQTTGEKWANGLQKFGAKTLNAVVGGTVGVLYGANSAIQDGSWSSIYDNKFSNWLNDLDTKLNYQLPNYYTRQEQQAGVFGQMGTANFWSDKFLGGLSFTTGAIVSEGIWAWATGGTSLASTGARLGGKLAGLGRVGRWSTEALGEANTIAGLAKTKGLFKALDFGEDALQAGAQSRNLAVNFGKAGEVLSIAGRTARSAGYEASVEALQYKKEAEEKFYKNFADLNGREPNAEEIAQFEKNNEATANAVFGANMAIVGTSNLIGLEHVLNIKNPVNLGISDFINKKAFGYGIDSVTKQVVKGSGKQKIARNVFDYLVKPSATEGLFEEGLQGVTNKTANKWIEHTYNPKYTNETFNQMEAFTTSLAEQYGSEEGWKENILGMLIGVAGGSVNVRGEQKAKEAELDMKASVDRNYNTQTLQSLILPHRVQTANRISAFTEEANNEEDKGNLSKSQVAKVGAVTSYVNSKLVLGESISDMTKEMKVALDAMTSEQWKEIGIENDQIDQEKEERISEFKNLAQNWKTNKDYVQYMIGNKIVGEKDLEGTKLEGIFGNFSKNTQIVEALTWQLTVGEQSGKIMKDVTDKLESQVKSEHLNAIKTAETLSLADKKLTQIFSETQKELKSVEQSVKNLEKEIIKLQNAPKQEGEVLSNRLKSANTLFLDKQEKLEFLKQKREEIFTQIQQQEANRKNFSRFNIDENVVEDFVYVADLDNLENNLNNFKQFLDTSTNQYMLDLIKEYSDAKDMFLQAQTTQKALVSPEFKIKNIDGWLDNLFNKNSAMNQNTQEWFTDSINKYNDFIKDTILPQVNQNQEQLEQEVEQGEVSQESLQSIADKKSNNLELTKTELNVYNGSKETIDNLIKESNLKTKPKSIKDLYEEDINILIQDTKNQESKKKEISDKILEIEGKRSYNLIAQDRIKSFIENIELGNIYDFNEIDNILKTLTKSKETRETYNLIKKTAKDLDVKVSFSFKNDFEERTSSGYYSLATHGIDINLSKLLSIPNSSTREISLVMVHEMVHGVSNYVVNQYESDKTVLTDKQIQAVEKLKELNKRIKSEKTSVAEMYGAKNIDEMMAELANPDFSRKLTNLQVDYKGKTIDFNKKVKNGFFDKTINTIFDFFKSPINYQEQTKKALYNIMSDASIEILKAQSSMSAQTEEMGDLKQDSTIEEVIKNRESQIDSTKELNKLKKELEKVNNKIRKINTSKLELQRTSLRKQGLFVDKSQSDLDQYKQVFENLVALDFNNLINVGTKYDDFNLSKPTELEIEEFKTLDKKNQRYKDLKQKFDNWKLMEGSYGDSMTSLADLIDIIQLLETQVEQEDTKDEVTEEEAKDIVNEATQIKGTGNADAKNITNISTEPVVAKIKDNGDIEFSHLKARYIVEQIGGAYNIKRGKNYLKNPNIDQVEPGDIIEIDNTSFYMDNNYRLVFNYEELKSRQQQLNLYVEEAQTYANFTSVYSIFGDQKVKTPSQFEDVEINREATFNVKIGDILTLHVKDTDGWNKTKKGSTLEQFKIYLKDKDGNIVYNLKSGNAKYEESVDENFANIRLRAFQNWEAQDRPDQMDLGISLKVGSMLYGAPELLYSDGKLIDGDISLEATKDVIIGKGFIENGELTLDIVKTFDKSQVSTAYVGKLTKNNPNLKIPIVVFEVGSNIIAFPITMKKTNSPIEFDVLLQGTPQEIVKKINQAIIDNKVKTQKLTFEDVTLDYNGEVQLSENAEKVRDAFTSKTTFVDASRLADKKYKIENLVNDASIRIDLEDVKKVFSAPKVILDLSSAEIKQSKEVKYENMTDIENTLNNLILELDKDYRINATTKYLNSKGDIIEKTKYTETLDDANFLTDGSNISKIHNINLLRETLSENLPKSLVRAIGADKIKTAKKLLKQYDSLKAQSVAKEEEVKNGLDNLDKCL